MRTVGTQILKAILPGLVAIWLPLAAAAHEFTLFYLVPPDISAAEEEEMRRAFLIASHERDNHPNETSDGHLGGVDVHLTIMALKGDEMLIALQPDLVAIPREWDGQDAVIARFATAPLALPPSDAVRATYLAEAADPVLPPFAEAYAAEGAGLPSDWAEDAYVMARLIGAAVRPLDGTQPAESLQSALDTLRAP